MENKLYTIKEVADKTGISAHTLRFYDKEGLLPFVKRTENGIRLFSEEDFEPLYSITIMKQSGMSIKQIREFMNLYIQGNSTIPQRRAIYEQQRINVQKKIDELKSMLKIIDYKCWYFKEAEKYQDINFYQSLPEDEVPEQIKDFLCQVKEFHSK